LSLLLAGYRETRMAGWERAKGRRVIAPNAVRPQDPPRGRAGYVASHAVSTQGNREQAG
jgi:hypothetical protein